MTTKVDIANMALGHLGQKKVVSDLGAAGDPVATVLNRFYKSSKAVTLTALNWSFARETRHELELLETLHEDSNEIYIFRYPSNFLADPIVFTVQNGMRYKVPFKSYRHKNSRALETCYSDCQMSYIIDLDESDYFPRLDLLHSFKLANLARNSITLGDGAIPTSTLDARFNALLSEMGQDEYDLGNDFSGTVNTFEEASLLGVNRYSEY